MWNEAASQRRRARRSSTAGNIGCTSPGNIRGLRSRPLAFLWTSTLGFNDRPGFRTGHSLRVRPWDRVTGTAMRLETIPTVFMDSHFYDYGQIDAGAIRGAMKYWIDEVRSVGGEAAVNWHPHTITKVYGWRDGFEELLALL